MSEADSVCTTNCWVELVWLEVSLPPHGRREGENQGGEREMRGKREPGRRDRDEGKERAREER